MKTLRKTLKKSLLQQELENLSEGSEVVFATQQTSTNIDINGTSFTPDAMQNKSTGYVDTAQKVRDSHDAYESAKAAWEAIEPEARGFYNNAKQGLKAKLGENSPSLPKMGIANPAARKPRKKTTKAVIITTTIAQNKAEMLAANSVAKQMDSGDVVVNMGTGKVTLPPAAAATTTAASSTTASEAPAAPASTSGSTPAAK